MPVVEGRELGLLETFGHRDDGGVHEPQREVDVAAQELSDPRVVIPDELLHRDGSALDVGEERVEGLRRQTSGGEPVELHDDGRGDEAQVGVS